MLVLDLGVFWMAVLLVLAGFSLGIGQPLSMSIVSAAASEGTRGTWMSIRLLGNRLGQAVIPVGVGIFATGLGAGGVFAVLGSTMAAATLGSILPLRSMGAERRTPEASSARPPPRRPPQRRPRRCLPEPTPGCGPCR